LVHYFLHHASFVILTESVFEIPYRKRQTHRQTEVKSVPPRPLFWLLRGPVESSNHWR